MWRQVFGALPAWSPPLAEGPGRERRSRESAGTSEDRLLTHWLGERIDPKHQYYLHKDINLAILLLLWLKFALFAEKLRISHSDASNFVENTILLLSTLKSLTYSGCTSLKEDVLKFVLSV